MGSPTPTSGSETWYHNGALLDFNALGVATIANGVIITPAFTSDHEGDYTVMVTTSVGTGSDTFYLNLDCKFTVSPQWP